MTYIVVEKVCAEISHMIEDYGDINSIPSISINFPYAQFLDNNLTENLLAILNTYELEPSNIKIEITERTLIEESVLLNLFNRIYETIRVCV